MKRVVVLISSTLVLSCVADGSESDNDSSGGSDGTAALRLELVTTIAPAVLDVGHVAAITADEDGRVYVLDSWPASEQLVVFSAEGERIDRLAGPGEGPGEIADPLHALPWKADTLFVLDTDLRRLSAFDRDLELVRTQPWPPEAGFLTTAYGAGSAVFGMSLRSRLDWEHIEATVARIDPRDLAPSWTDSIIGDRYLYCWEPNGDMAPIDVSFNDLVPLTAFLSDGRMARAYPGEAEIRLMDPKSGEATGAIQVRYEPIPFREADFYRTAGGGWARQFERDGGGPLVDEDRESPCPLSNILPELAPPVFSLITDDEDRLWIEAVDPAVSEGLTLAAYAVDGTLLGAGPMPERDARVSHFVRGDRLYLVTVDDLGLQAVEIYRIHVTD